jgi:hypothetical protein
MRKFTIAILFIMTSISCDKDLGNLIFKETIPGGCALHVGVPNKSVQIIESDTVTYSVTDGNLDIFVGFNASCCGQYSKTATVKGDSILIQILTTQFGLCNCMCYYTYNFKFLGRGNSYNYRVNIDDYKVFNGHIKP